VFESIVQARFDVVKNSEELEKILTGFGASRHEGNINNAISQVCHNIEYRIISSFSGVICDGFNERIKREQTSADEIKELICSFSPAYLLTQSTEVSEGLKQLDLFSTLKQRNLGYTSWILDLERRTPRELSRPTGGVRGEFSIDLVLDYHIQPTRTKIERIVHNLIGREEAGVRDVIAAISGKPGLIRQYLLYQAGSFVC
jgi:hypothetical protein